MKVLLERIEKRVLERQPFKDERAKRGVEVKGHGLGFSESEQKWYGWSNRAMCGFGIGDKVFEADFGGDDTPFDKHGKRTIKSMRDAMEAARNFKKYVS